MCLLVHIRCARSLISPAGYIPGWLVGDRHEEISHHPADDRRPERGRSRDAFEPGSGNSARSVRPCLVASFKANFEMQRRNISNY